MTTTKREADLTEAHREVLTRLRDNADNKGWAPIGHRPYGRLAVAGRPFDRATLRRLDELGYVDDWTSERVHLTTKGLDSG